MKTQCVNTRKVILESSKVELLTPELEAAKLHLQECKECQTFFADQEELRNFIKDNLPKAKIPAAVREEIFRSISKKKNKRIFSISYLSAKGTRRVWWAAAAAILLISLFLLNPFEEEQTDVNKPHQLTEELINDYIRYRMSEQPAEFTTDNPQELNKWFSRKVDFNVRFSSVDELQLVGGRLCFLFDRRVALAFYKKPDQWVSIFILKDNNIDLSEMKTEKLKNKTVWCGRNRGYELAIWKQNDLLYALVTDSDCMELAETLNTGIID